jgi:hypothetical protein
MRLLPFVVGLVILCIGLGSLVGNLVLNLRARRAGAPTSRERLVLEAQRRSVVAGRATAAQVALAAATRRSASLAKLDKRLAALERMAGGRGGAVVALGRNGGVPFTGLEYIAYPPSLQLRASGQQQQQRAGTTVTAWVRLESEAAVINTIFATRLPGCNGNGASHLGISLAVNSWQTADQQLVAEWGVGGGSGASSVAPSCARLVSGAVNVVPRDRWAHVALVIAAVGSTLYLDGDAVATQGAGMPAPLHKQKQLLREREREGGKPRVADAPLPFTVGAHAGGGSPFGGRMARLCVWDGAMTAADVRAEIGLLRAGGALAVPGYPLGNARLLASLLSDAKAPGMDATGTNKDGVAYGFERPWDRKKVQN